MNARATRKKFIVVSFLILISVITSIWLIAYVPELVKASPSGLTAKKIELYNNQYAKLMAQAKQYHATHPDNNPVILPMGPDPKIKVQCVPSDIGWSFGWLCRGPYKVSELWIVGDKPYYQMKSWNTAYAFSGCFKDNPRQGFIGTFVLNGASDMSWSGVWKTPQLWGSVKITNVNASGIIASFLTDTGVKGTFNLDSHVWMIQCESSK